MNDNIDFDNLKILESKSCIKVFKKINSNSSLKENINRLRESCKILDDCNRMKKKKLLDLSINLKHLANGNININNIKTLQEEFYNEINNIDHIMNIIYNYKLSEENYIEIYGD
jgi:hypothetical protein